MKFSVITASLNMLPYLKMCHFSVMNQSVEIEHIVIDGGSNDGTVDWLKNNKSIKYLSEIDNGMYDAINKGINIASGDIISILNCDEQYLPESLTKIKNQFTKAPKIDFIYGNKININPDGTFNSFKKSFTLRKGYILTSSLYLYTCSAFFKKDIFNNLKFNTNYKSVGDAEFVINLLEKKLHGKYINYYTSTFTITNNNLSQKKLSRIERVKLVKEHCKYNKFIIIIFRFLKIAEKTIKFKYYQKFPLSYSVYSKNGQKKNIVAYKGSWLPKWK